MSRIYDKELSCGCIRFGKGRFVFQCGDCLKKQEKKEVKKRTKDL